MTDKELHRLRRQDLLQLLLSQSQEASEQQQTIERLEKQIEELTAANERLAQKAEDKDAVIAKLVGLLAGGEDKDNSDSAESADDSERTKNETSDNTLDE